MSPTARLWAWAPILVILLALGVFLVGPYWTSWQAKYQKLRQLHRYQAQSEILLQQVAAGTNNIQTTPDAAFLSGPSHAAAVAGLSQRLTEAAADAGCQLQSLQPAAEDADNPGRLTIEVKLTAATRNLQKFIYDLETGPPMLRVHDMHINVSYQYQAAGNLGAEAGALEVRFVVESFWQLGDSP